MLIARRCFLIMEFVSASSSSSAAAAALFSRSPPRGRGLHFLLAVSIPLVRDLRSRPLAHRHAAASPRARPFSVRASAGGGGPIVARPSSELRRGRSGGNDAASGGGDEKLRALRELFSRPGVEIDAYIVPSQDAHQSEFIAECFMRRAYISGFTGSAGTAVITKDKAALWTDGRYFLQAEKQLNQNWILMRAGNFGVPTTSEWLNDVLAPGCKIGIDPFLFSSDAAKELKEEISKKNHELVFLYDLNLIDEVWKESRPKPPAKPTRVHDIRYAGVDISSKLASLRSQLIEAGATAIVISMLDEVAWLLNMRGNDVPNSPVFYSYLIVEMSEAKLFIDKIKVTAEVAEHLNDAGVEVRPYEDILPEIERLAARGEKLWLDPSSVNAAIMNIFEAACEKYLATHKIRERKKNGSELSTELQPSKTQDTKTSGPSGLYLLSPVALAKSVKNESEIEGMRNSHIRDAAALAEFWAWIEEEIHKEVALTEVEVSDKLLEFRQKQSGFLDTSFDTISGYGANGAVIHYKPNPESCSIVDDKNLFLLDSGAQYIDGTTDVTRTVHFGEPSLRQKECFTRVLQGHIAIDQAVFPERTPGFVLDVLARSPLWKVGLDYRHGTGHGVGAALNVHEGPQSISFRFGNMTALQKGMVVSNEPGYYEDNMFGIRIENLLHVKEVKLPNSFGGVGYLGFERLTFVPIQAKLVELSLLSSAEINWLNDYHTQVWEKISPFLDGSAREWLWNNTRPLPTK